MTNSHEERVRIGEHLAFTAVAEHVEDSASIRLKEKNVVHLFTSSKMDEIQGPMKNRPFRVVKTEHGTK